VVKIEWTPLALKDLQVIYDYIASDSPFYADKTMEKIIERVEVLQSHQEIGKIQTT
jgi:toxin ParE1/3/4